MAKRYRMLIDGEWLGDDRTGIEVINPFDDSLIGLVPEATAEDVEAAIIAAAKGFERISAMPAHKRSDILEKTAELILRDKDEIAGIIAREAGKSWKYAVAEAERSAETFKFAAIEAKASHGEIVPMDASAVSAGRFGFYIRTPIGIIGAITPFNFPLNLVAHKLAPAIATGNAWC